LSRRVDQRARTGNRELRQQLEPITISGACGNNGATNAAPSPVECNIEHAIRIADERVQAMWNVVSALRAQLRV
jgi:hypothetical protein